MTLSQIFKSPSHDVGSNTAKQKSFLSAFIWMLSIYLLSQAVLFWIFGAWHAAWAQDALAHSILGSILYAMARGFWPWAIAYAVWLAVLQFASGLKMVLLGNPIMPDDVLALSNMLHLYDGWRLFAIWLALLLPLASLIYAIAWRRPRAWGMLLSIMVLGAGFWHWAAPISTAMDDYFGDRPWDQRGNYKLRGIPLHLVQEGARHLARSKVEIEPQQAQQALLALRGDTAGLDAAARLSEPRNLYIILLESFWDPMALHAAGIEADPFDPRLRELWRQTGHSRALSPVFGGYTANSEFEVLCGFPVIHNGAFFEGWLRNDVACLPGYLREAGYRTAAAHPNYPAFWNRVNAYRRVGFDHYWASPDFQLDDMNYHFLSDQSLYRQTWEKIQPWLHSGKPVLSYIVTIFGHYDYPLNSARPKRIKVAHNSGLIDEYVNQVYYKSRELMDFYELLRREDPRALIVMFGDHLPLLGQDYDGYVESGLLAHSKNNFTPQMFARLVTTPLIIVDGQRGPVAAGVLPIYQIPARLLQLLGDRGRSLMTLTQAPARHVLRPLPGMTLLLDQTNSKRDAAFICPQGSQQERCRQTDQWLQQVTTLMSDVFSGEQYSLGRETMQGGLTKKFP